MPFLYANAITIKKPKSGILESTYSKPLDQVYDKVRATKCKMKMAYIVNKTKFTVIIGAKNLWEDRLSATSPDVRVRCSSQH